MADGRYSENPYKAEYPHNQVTVYPSGHEVHFDSTKDNERIRIAHSDGTFWEISKGGKATTVTVGNKEEYNKGGVTITVDHNHDVLISGHQIVRVGGGSHIQVAGDADVSVGGNMTSVVAGNMATAVKGNSYSATQGDSKINVNGNADMKVGGSYSMESGGDASIKAPTINLDGNIKHTGDMDTSGVHTDSLGGHAG